ncbi:MAG: hypothetical protein ACLQBB_15335 [Solirubrobacteraceae bacterium]
MTMLAPASGPELSKAALQHVIERADGNAGPALSEHIAANTPLSVEQVKPAVDTALASLPEGADSATAAEVTKQAVTELVPKFNLELSEAVMLNGTVRTVFAGIFTLIFLGGIFAIVGVGTESDPSETTLIALVIVTVLALLVSLVLVMGYKNVEAKLEPASS